MHHHATEMKNMKVCRQTTNTLQIQVKEAEQNLFVFAVLPNPPGRFSAGGCYDLPAALLPCSECETGAPARLFCSPS